MIKSVLITLCATGCLMALPAAAATPDTALLTLAGALSTAPEKPAQIGTIKIGDRLCPAVPDNAAPDKLTKILKLVSTTCIMEASGLVTHDEAQSVYDQAFGIVMAALGEIYMDDTPALASK